MIPVRKSATGYNQGSLHSILERVAVFGRMIRFSHTIFALPFALSALVLAGREAPLTFYKLFWVLVAMVGARSAAMGVNRMADARFDAKNPRTAAREIPSGKLSMKAAAATVAGASALFVLAAAMLGKLCFYLSFPVLAVLFFYSFTKRFTSWCHLYLGLAISLAPLGAWIAITEAFSWSIVPMSLALLTYIAGFDILYACQDIDFDKSQGLNSLPARLGIKKALSISELLHAISFLFFISLYFIFDMGQIYLFAAGVIGVFLFIEQWLVKPHDLSRVPIAFFHMNSLVSVTLFFGVLFDELL